MFSFSRTRWIAYLHLNEGYIFCVEAGWVSMNVISKSQARIMSFGTIEEARHKFSNIDIKNIEFIEVGESYYPLNN